MSSFATLQQVITLSGASYTQEEQTRIEALLPMVSDLIRNEGKKVGKDVDALIAADASYASVVTLVTVDVIVRVMRQSTTGDPMSQESQSALCYSWSGSYAIPGGGIAMSLMNNELKRLGFRTQTIQGVKLWPIGCSGTE
jgi:hypothetical protein